MGIGFIGLHPEPPIFAVLPRGKTIISSGERRGGPQETICRSLEKRGGHEKGFGGESRGVSEAGGESLLLRRSKACAKQFRGFLSAIGVEAEKSAKRNECTQGKSTSFFADSNSSLNLSH